jgi:hypothetical protein
MYEDTIKWLRSVVERKETVHGDPPELALKRLEDAAKLHEKIMAENRKEK